MPRQQAQAKADTKRSRAKSFRSKRRLAALRRRILGELAVYGGTFGFIANLLGLLGLSRLLNVSIAAASLVIVFLFRRRSTVLVLKTLYLQSAFYPYLYVVAFILVLAVVGYSTFAAGKKAGYSAGVRSVLTVLNLPTRPLPPPPPRFPGDVNLDEYCRSRGPYQVMAPTDVGIFVQVPGSPPILGPLPFSKEQMAAIEARLGKNVLLCQSRMRQPTSSSAESESVFFRVNEACAWQYPSQRVEAIPPKDRRYIDQWRCHVVSGPPATWP
jgi:hypothetical protein